MVDACQTIFAMSSVEKAAEFRLRQEATLLISEGSSGSAKK